MSEEAARQKLYGYKENSNLVLQANRSARRGGGPAEAIESLRGRDLPKMGSRLDQSSTVSNKRPAELKERLERSKERSKRKSKRRKVGLENLTGAGKSILEMDHLTGYQPSHAGSRAGYESILSIVGSKQYLGAQPADVLRDAAEELMSILKNDGLRDPERQMEISKLLLQKNGLSTDEFARLVALGKRIDDYDTKNEGSRDKELDDEMGVAVVFDDSDEEQDSDEDSEVDEVVEADESSDEEESASDIVTSSQIDKGGGADLDEGDAGQAGGINVHDIDAHWLQRQLSKFIDDADASVQTSDKVLSVLELQDVRECENKLLSTLGFDMFDFIKLLLVNRVKILACIRLKRAQSDEEKRNIEADLLADPSGEGAMILKQLHSNASAENWTKDRMSQMASKARREAKQLNHVKSVKESGTFVEEVDVAVVSGGDAEGAIELDLESLAFKEGAHLMSNKKVTLPDKSWRAMKKGYEEVHVPAIRSIPSSDEKLIPIADLPEWTHNAFEGTYF